MGFKYVLPSWSSKWRWGPVAMPVSPTLAISWPRFTALPEDTSTALQWA